VSWLRAFALVLAAAATAQLGMADRKSFFSAGTETQTMLLRSQLLDLDEFADFLEISAESTAVVRRNSVPQY
jgi:hypothetical protein